MINEPDVSVAPAKFDIADLIIAGVIGLMLTYTAIFLCVMPLVSKIASGRDLVVYWATGQQLVHHANPYDADAIARLEHSAGFPATYKVGFMRNPPYGLPLTLPLGLFGIQIAAILWNLAQLACLGLSVRMLWQMHGRPRSPMHWLLIAFTPSLLGLTMGQTSLFALLGYVLFLRLHGSQPFLAGLSLWLCALKPHLFVPFGIVLLAWVFYSRSYKILAGAAAALAASCTAVYCFDPTAWADYAHMMRTYGIENEIIPCLSVMLRLWISPKTMWLQYLPVALGCAWGLVYFWPRRSRWDWIKDGSLLMLVSIFVSPYCWLFDQALAIPALLRGAYLTRSRILQAILALASLSIQIELLCNIKVTSAIYLWTAPAWLAWYLFACSYAREPEVE